MSLSFATPEVLPMTCLCDTTLCWNCTAGLLALQSCCYSTGYWGETIVPLQLLLGGALGLCLAVVLVGLPRFSWVLVACKRS